MDPAHPETPTAPPRAGPPEAVRPADYREAAAARLDEAQRLLDTGSPGMALYLAGVAAECVLRSELPAGLPFDGRHDLRRLATSGLLAGSHNDAWQRRYDAVHWAWMLWRNSFRYMSEAKTARVLHSLGHRRGHPQRGLALVRDAAATVVVAARFLYDSTRAAPRPPGRK